MTTEDMTPEGALLTHSELTGAESPEAGVPETELEETDFEETELVETESVETEFVETLFHGAPWRQAVESTFDVDIRRFVPQSEPDGHGYYSLISDIRGDRIVCTPFSDFCDPFMTADGWSEFAAHLRSFDVPVTVRPFRNEAVSSDSSFERRQELLWHGVDLSEGADKIWDGLKTGLRTSIRRAAKEGISFRISSDMDDVKAFHKMHVNLRKSKYRLLAQPLSFFEQLAERFGDDMALVLAEKDGELVAGMIYYAWEGVWYYKFGASYPAKYRPNAAMIVEACREGEARGLQLLDMGRSDIDQPGLVQFKQQFATEELPLTTLHWSPDVVPSSAHPDIGKTLGEMTDLLTDPNVPDEVTAQGGDLLYRFFG